MAEADLKWALDEFRDSARLNRYELALSYYLGDHRMAFATEKFRSTFGRLFQAFSDNLCPAVIDSLVDRLELNGFTSTSAEGERPDAGRDVVDPVDEHASRAWTIWRRNGMDLRSNEVHREALLKGDGFVIVERNERGQAVIWPQKAHEMAVRYREDVPGEIEVAAKLWRTFDNLLRLNLYFADRIEKYRSRRPVKGGVPISYRTIDFEPLPADGSWTGEAMPNQYGRVPVFHFPNKWVYGYGLGELLDVIPLQDALNKANIDMVVAMEFSSFRQRWATGLEVEVDPVSGRPTAPPFDLGVDRIVAASDAGVRFGEFSQTDLSQFLQVAEAFRSEIARVSGTPLHYLFITRGDFPSGEAMKSAEARFTRKIRDRQIVFGESWEQVFALALEMEGEKLPEGAELEAVWETASPRTEREITEGLLMKKALGASSRQLLKELGYDDALITEMLASAEREPPPTPGMANEVSVRDPLARNGTPPLPSLTR